MKERPILFSGPMARAILEGCKTQTRRVVKPQPSPDTQRVADVQLMPPRADGTASQPHWMPQFKGLPLCPYGLPGDRLWVRETHYLFGWWEMVDGEWHFHYERERGVLFEPPADLQKGRSNLILNKGWYKRPSIFMPRWASRINLEITNVRVERLQGISEADAIAEGVELLTGELSGVYAIHGNMKHGGAMSGTTARECYSRGWDMLNAKRGYSWESNPWVWVIEFKKL